MVWHRLTLLHLQKTLKSAHLKIKQRSFRIRRAKRAVRSSSRLTYEEKLRSGLRRQIIPGFGASHYKAEQDSKSLESINVPILFSLIGNVGPVCAFFAKLDNCFKSGKGVLVDLSRTKELHASACVVLRFYHMKFLKAQVRFQGVLPKEDKVLEEFIETGYFHVEGELDKGANEYFLFNDSNKIYTSLSDCVDSEQMAKLIANASSLVWGEERRCLGLMTCLLELMNNTVDHASGSEARSVTNQEKWLVCFNRLPDKSGISICFVDLGVGVFESLSLKDSLLEWRGKANKWKDWSSKLMAFKGINMPKDNAHILREILSGRFHATCIGENHRGMGLRGIGSAMNDRNSISNLCIITNDVYANVRDQEYVLTSAKFCGTFVYMELRADNKSYDFVV